MNADLIPRDDLPEGSDPFAPRIPTRRLTRKQWLAFRRFGIGSSDAAACLGEDPFGKTPYALYMEKTGQWEAEDLSDNQAVEVGNDLEEYCARKFASRTGMKVRRDHFIRRSNSHPHMLANIDRLTTTSERVVECKTSLGRWALNSDAWGEDGSADVPEHVMLQLTHQMVVMSDTHAFVAALLAKPRFCVYRLPFNRKLANVIIDAERELWDRIVKGEPPAVTSLADAKRAFPTSRAIEVQASQEIVDDVTKLRMHKTAAASNEKEIETLQGRIAGFMADADTLMHRTTRLLTYKTVERKGFEVAPSSSRQFRLDKLKGEPDNS